MRFTRFHWILSSMVTLLATIVFAMIAIKSNQKPMFFGFSIICGLYALFSLLKAITFQKQQYLNEEEDEVLYKTSCPSCGEPLAGHELYCPKCGAFLPKVNIYDEDVED